MPNFLERLVNSFCNPSQYRYHGYSFKREYRERTPFGFIAPYRIRGTLTVKDRAAFQHAIEHRDGNPTTAVNRIVDEFHGRVFQPLFEQHRLFFHYDTNDYGQILLDMWQYDEQPDGTLAVQWANYYQSDGLRLSVKHALRDFTFSGCVIDVVNFDCLENGVLCTEENVRMLHPEAMAFIRKDGVYLRFVEQICVAALAERAKLFRDPKTYGQDSLTTIRTTHVGDALKLAWKNPKAGEGWKLLGFRKTGGFAPNETSETENGVLVVDSAYQEGETVEAKLPRNEPLYYTFFLRKWEQKIFSNEAVFRYWPVARFSETIPDQDTVQALVKQLEETRLKAQIAEAERKAEEAKQGKMSLAEMQRRHLSSQIELAKDAVSLLQAVNELEVDALAELDRSASSRFTPERVTAWRDDVADLFTRLREKVMQLR